jgi:hypothetical protein
MPKAPEVVVYDFACQLHEYCLNREPEYYKHTLFVIDKLHQWNHSDCSLAYRDSVTFGYWTIYMGGRNHWVSDLNSQAVSKKSVW